MKIVIDISDEGYDWIKNGFPDNEDKEFLIKAVKNGTVIAPTEKAKVGELIDAYTKGFDAGVEIARNERPQGEWIETQRGIHVTNYKCFCCGRTVRDDTGYDVSADYPFCHCGADMRGEKDG